MAETFRQWVFARPFSGGALTPSNFELRELKVADLAPGQALVRVLVIGLHPNLRSRMANGATPIGETDRSNLACAQVLRSRDSGLPEGSIISCQTGWQELDVISSAAPAVGFPPATPMTMAANRTASQWTYVIRPALTELWPPDVLISTFGPSGLAAYFGIRSCGPVTPRDTVLIGGVTGGVGSVAAQLARIAGARVIGTAGDDVRCARAVQRLGLDHCLNYNDPQMTEHLRRVAPTGVDVVTDGAGGSLIRQVVDQIAEFGRVWAFGNVAGYYDEPAPPPIYASLRELLGLTPSLDQALRARRIKAESFLVDTFYHEREAAENEMSRLILSGALKPTNNLTPGFEDLPKTLCSLYRGRRWGRLQVGLSAQGASMPRPSNIVPLVGRPEPTSDSNASEPSGCCAGGDASS